MLLIELWQQIRGTFYRAGDQLREERNKQGILPQCFGRFYFIAIDINYITYSLEGIERYWGSGVIPWQSYPKMIDKRYMKNGRSDTPCS